MTSKKQLRAEIEKLKQEAREIAEKRVWDTYRDGLAKEAAARAEAERAATQVRNEKRLNIQKGLIPVDELRKLVTEHKTNRGVMNTRTTITLDVFNPAAGIEKDIIDALSKPVTPSYAPGGLVGSGGIFDSSNIRFGGYTGAVRNPDTGLIHGVTIS